MSDRFYSVVCALGRPVFRICSRPVILHRERVPTEGGALLTSNHLSPYDVPCLMYATKRHIDFVSIVEFFRIPSVRWFFSSLNAMPLDRGRVDSATVRSIIERLRAGRLVGIFPEAGIRRPDDSMLAGGSFRRGIGRMAVLAGVPIVPCVALDTSNFSRLTAWIPVLRTRFAIAYGEPIQPPRDMAGREAHEWLEERWRTSMLELYAELKSVYLPEPAPASATVTK